MVLNVDKALTTHSLINKLTLRLAQIICLIIICVNPITILKRNKIKDRVCL